MFAVQYCDSNRSDPHPVPGAAEQVPPEAAPVDSPGQQVAEVLLQELDRVGPHSVPLSGRSGRTARERRIEGTAEVGDGPRAGGRGQSSASMSWGIEAHVLNGSLKELSVEPGCAQPRSASGRTEPELEGLGGDRAETLQHVVPLPALSRQLGAGVARPSRGEWRRRRDRSPSPRAGPCARHPASSHQCDSSGWSLDPVGVGELVDPRGGREAGQCPGETTSGS